MSRHIRLAFSPPTEEGLQEFYCPISLVKVFGESSVQSSLFCSSWTDADPLHPTFGSGLCRAGITMLEQFKQQQGGPGQATESTKEEPTGIRQRKEAWSISGVIEKVATMFKPEKLPASSKVGDLLRGRKALDQRASYRRSHPSFF